ncbi:MAG: hypothetical protein IH951_16300, partial [Bacteroidetes bacterium]|nr:hypothetical protein [Bacteroidota bacterium]
FTALPKDAEGSVNRKQFKRLLAKSASDMDQFSARVDAELPLFQESLAAGIDALIKLTTLSVDLKEDDDDTSELEDRVEIIMSLKDSLKAAREGTSDFRETVAKLPRMTTEFNRSKRKTVRVLDVLLHELGAGEKFLIESEPNLLALIGK